MWQPRVEAAHAVLLTQRSHSLPQQYSPCILYIALLMPHVILELGGKPHQGHITPWLLDHCGCCITSIDNALAGATSLQGMSSHWWEVHKLEASLIHALERLGPE